MASPSETFTVRDPDGWESTVDAWLPAGEPVAALHVLHGWAEHAARYERFAVAANGSGLAVYVDDHRGHGRTGLAAGGLGDLGPRGMDGVLDAAHAVTQEVRRRHPGIPLFLLGHSWGSFLGQRYVRRWPDELDAVVLTGTTYRRPDAAAPAARTGGPNAAFEPAATPYDWLSRDADEVRKYLEDPWCGTQAEAFASARPMARPADAKPEPDASPRLDLPIAIFNGSADPVGGDEGGKALAEHYREQGYRHVELHLYDGARHELLNETNRDEVTADLLEFFSERLSSPAP